MKNKIAIVSILLAALFLTSCGDKAEHYEIEAKTPSFDTLQEMEDDSDVIVKVTRGSEETPVINLVKENVVGSGYTFSKVTVDEIYKDTSNSLKIGDELRILENEFYYEEDNAVYHVAGYNMMVDGKAYLLFLHKNLYYDHEPYYVSAGVNYGTVSLEDDGRDKVYFSKESYKINFYDYFQPIWDEAIEKYVN